MTRAHHYGLPLRAKVIASLGALGVGMAYLLHLTELAFWDLPWWLDTPASLGFAALLYVVLDRFAWHWRVLSALLRVPDLRGTWTGKLETSYDDFAKARDVRVEISQTWSALLVTLHNLETQSCSHSLGGYVVEIGDGSFEVVFTYQNQPDSTSPNTMQIHQGTTVLRLSQDRQRLDGHYFSGRERRTHGRLALARSPAAKHPHG